MGSGRSSSWKTENWYSCGSQIRSRGEGSEAEIVFLTGRWHSCAGSRAPEKTAVVTPPFGAGARGSFPLSPTTQSTLRGLNNMYAFKKAWVDPWRLRSTWLFLATQHLATGDLVPRVNLATGRSTLHATDERATHGDAHFALCDGCHPATADVHNTSPLARRTSRLATRHVPRSMRPRTSRLMTAQRGTASNLPGQIHLMMDVQVRFLAARKNIGQDAGHVLWISFVPAAPLAVGPPQFRAHYRPRFRA